MTNDIWNHKNVANAEQCWATTFIKHSKWMTEMCAFHLNDTTCVSEPIANNKLLRRSSVDALSQIAHWLHSTLTHTLDSGEMNAGNVSNAQFSGVHFEVECPMDGCMYLICTCVCVCIIVSSGWNRVSAVHLPKHFESNLFSVTSNCD